MFKFKSMSNSLAAKSLIYLMVRPPPAIGDFVLARQLVIPLRTREVIVLYLILVFFVNRHNHPPSARLLAVEKDHLLQRARHRDVELPIIAFVLELSFALSEDKAFHKIPENMGDELGGLVVEIQRGVVFIDAE